MSDINLDELRAALNDWACLVTNNHGAEGVYLFGSLVYRDGAQFTALSDVDIVVKFGSSMGALARANWVKQLIPAKKQLEITLLGLLERRIVEPFSSVVTITQAEIDLDVHKENQPSFYSSNVFVDLACGKRLDGLPGAGSIVPCHRLLAGSLSMTQKIRHQFLGIASNNRGVLQPFNGEDCIPKAIMRAAAMARSLADSSLGKGAEYDTRLGLDRLTHYLLDHENDDPLLENLSRLISERRGARGEGGPISPFDQLLLAEIVFDLSIKPTGGSGNNSSPPPVPPTPVPDTRALGNGKVTNPSQAVPETADQNPNNDTTPIAVEHEKVNAPLPSLVGRTTLVFFDERFRQAFPGIRDLTWFNDPADAISRLTRLLSKPLLFSDAAPIWWWRDGNLHIKSFEQIDESIVLMNYEELKVRRIACVPGPTYKRSFVYVEVDSMPPTGLYQSEAKYLAERVKVRGYASEEYGLYDGFHPFSRSEYDDGGTYIDGKYVDTTENSTLRVRYLTPYNFIIAAQNSPINNSAFDRQLVSYMNRALNEGAENVVKEFSDEVAMLPLKEYG